MIKRILLTIIVIVLLTACATPTASPALTSIPTRTPTTLPTETAPPTSTSTPEPTATLTQTDTLEPTAEPTETAEPTPTAEAEDIISNVKAGNYEAVKAGLETAVAAGEYTSMREAITEVLLPIFQEQTLYSEQAFARIAPEFASVEVNGQGQLQVLDADGDVLIESTVPGTSNLKWAIPIIKLAYGIEEVGMVEGVEFKEEERIEWFFSAFERGEVAKIKENGLHNGWFVLDDAVQLETSFELSTGEVITTLAKVHYLDSQGVQQMVYVPFFSKDDQKLMFHSFSLGTAQHDSVEEYEKWINRHESWEKNNRGSMTVEGQKNLIYGQIMFLGFNMTVNPELSSGAKDMFADAMSFYTQAQLDEFARTGDLSVLPEVPGYGPLLIPLSEGGSNLLTRYQDN